MSGGAGGARGESASAAPAASARDARDCLKLLAWGRLDADDMDISPSSTPRSDPERRQAAAAAAAVAAAANANAANSAPAAAAQAASPVAMPAALTAPPTSNATPSKQEDSPLTIELPPVGTLDGGPPTPTHSEHQDGAEPRKCKSYKNNIRLGPTILSQDKNLVFLVRKRRKFHFSSEKIFR